MMYREASPGIHEPTTFPLHASATTRVLRVSRDDLPPVAWKEAIGPRAKERIAHERSVLERLRGVEGAVQLAGGSHPEGILALEPCAPTTLAQALRSRRFALPEVLALGVALARILAGVHAAGVIHANVRPSNILLTADGQPVLVDFTRALTVVAGAATPTDMPDTLEYLAPEQTGRTGRAVDQRADLYALGGVLYEMTTGRRPFEATDALELIRDHLAHIPPAPSAVDPAIPGDLSRIILRLLAKDPDQRYQSAQGLAHDLARLGSTGGLPGASAPLALGARDFGVQLAAPDRPVGRERETAALVAAFEDGLRGGARGVLLTGAPGAGKSTLANELRPVVAARGGWYVSGKFDSQRQDIASDGMYQCLRGLGQLLLALPEDELAPLRSRLSDSVGPAGAPLIGVVPEISLLLGVPPDPVAVQAAPRERLVEVTLDLLRAVASPARPLVMLLDDLQWAPPLPLAGIHAVLSDATLNDVFLVCAWREGALDAAHPLATLLPRWERLARPPRTVAVPHLDAAGVASLLAQMLRMPAEKAIDLAGFVLEHTDGNPFDTVQLLDALRREGALALREGGWSWQADAIPRHIAQASVGRLLAGRVAALPACTRELLDVLACLGGAVDARLLQAASGVAPDLLLQRLEPAVADGLLQSSPAGIRFSHDRVQQAALERLATEQRLQLHLETARRLAATAGSAAAAQYLAALPVITDAAERRHAAALMRAAAIPLRTFNTVAADRLLAGAIALLESVEAAPHSLLPLRIERHAVLYALGRLEEAGQLYGDIERDCPDPLQLVDAAGVQVSALTNLGRPRDAVALGSAVLARLGVRLPDARQLKVHMSQGSALVFGHWLSPDVVTADLQRPDATDARALAAGRLLDRMMSASFFCDPETFAGMVLSGHRLWSTHGPAREFVGIVSHAAILSVTAWRDYRTARVLIDAVLRVGEGRGWEPETSKARFLSALGTHPWWEGLEQAVSEAQRAHQGLLEGGDLQNACFTFYASLYALLDCATLQRHAAEAEAALALSARTRNDYTALSYLAHRQLGRSLRGETAQAGGFDDAEFSEEGHEKAVQGDFVAAINFHATRALAALVWGDGAALARHGRAAAALAGGGSIYISTHAHLLHALGTAQSAQGLPGGDAAARLEEADASREWLAQRAADAPVQFGHLVAWVDAERAWALGDFRAAMAGFDAARWAAGRLSRPWQRAAITERCALCMLANGVRHAGEQVLAGARRHYAAWGATAKVRALENAHPFLQPLPARAEVPGLMEGPRDERMDMLALLRASQALSSNTSLAGLKAQLVELLGSITGATGVLLALWDAERLQWLLSASSGEAGPPMPVEAAARLGLLPLTPLQYADRTQEPLVVDDAVTDDRFSRDPYVQGLERCSLLVFPILRHGAPAAMLVLENRLARAAFSAARLDAVRLIAGQLAVSLENALVYGQLERRVEERTRELRAAQADLVATARKAGQAEIASNVLHNVGNVLNSVNVSAGVVMSRLRNSKVHALGRAVDMMTGHSEDLATFLTSDPKGRLLPTYLASAMQAIGAEQREISDEVARLVRSVDHIKNVVSTQQSYAGTSTLLEAADIGALVEEALRINGEALARCAVRVHREFQDVPLAELDRTRVTDILVNLVRNAIQAMEGVPDPRLTLQVSEADGVLRVRVADCGVGIAPDNLTRIFSHGFTTREAGHGFGLHSCALAARVMGGTLSAASAGTGCGAAFTLELPLSRASA